MLKSVKPLVRKSRSLAIPGLSSRVLVPWRLQEFQGPCTSQPRISFEASLRDGRTLSSQAALVPPHNDEEDGPTGILFSLDKPSIGADLVGATGMIRRTFGPRSNAEGLLATGGAALAAHASFDPDYNRAQDWIRYHAVGPAVLSPILISGLTGALTEAAFPHGVNTAQSMRLKRPLIVGVPVAAMIQVVAVQESRKLSPLDDEDEIRDGTRKHGYDVVLKTLVTRVRDDCVIAEGTHELWVPDFGRM
jgi:hypothetical protein